MVTIRGLKRAGILALALAGVALTGRAVEVGAQSPQGSAQGTLRVRHGDEFAANRAFYHYEVLTDDRRIVQVDFPNERPGEHVALAGRRVNVQGNVTANGRIAVADGGVTAMSVGTPQAAVAGTRNVAVLLINFSNDASTPWTTDQVTGAFFTNSNSVKAYYEDVSNGAMSISGQVFGWFTIPATNANCDANYGTWGTQANNAATNAGVPLANFQHIVYAFPAAPLCNWAGLAYMPGSTSWLNNAATSLRVAAHELGHNFGVHHASSYSCTVNGVKVALSTSAANCALSEYGDPYTVMGAAQTRMHNNYHRYQYGWFAPRVVTTTGQYLLAPADAASGDRLLRIARPDGTFLDLEFRQPTTMFDTFTATDPAVNGVTVRINTAINSINVTKLIDTTPGSNTNSDFVDAALAVGRTFTDPANGVQVTTQAVGASGATVYVSFVADTQAPTAPATVTASTVTATAATLTWPASTDNVAVAGYNVYRNGAFLRAVTTTTVTDTGLTANTTYTYAVEAYDAATNKSARTSQAVTTLAPDTVAPSAPGTLTASLRKSTATLTWGAATDNVGVAKYQVFRNGKLLKEVTTLTTTDNKLARGANTYVIYAVDAAGNVGPGSNSVTITK